MNKIQYKVHLNSMLLFYKSITKSWFSVEDNVIHALGMLLDLRKAYSFTKHSPGARVFYALRKSSNIPSEFKCILYIVFYSAEIYKHRFLGQTRTIDSHALINFELV